MGRTSSHTFRFDPARSCFLCQMSRSRTELATVAWGALTFGALLASFSAFRPVRDALVLDGNPDDIPWLFTATLIASLIASPLWSRTLSRRKKRRVVLTAYHVFAGCLAVFASLVAAGIEP